MSIVKTLVISSAAIVGGVMVLGVIGAVAAGSSATKSIEGKSDSATSDAYEDGKRRAEEALSRKDKSPGTFTPKRTEAQQVMDCMDRTEVKQLDYSPSSFMSTANVYTNLTGDLFSTSSQGKGQLIVAAFTRCAPSTGNGTGLVTVYSASGDLLANGNF